MSDVRVDQADKSPGEFRFTLRQLLIFVVACSVGCFLVFRVVVPTIRQRNERTVRGYCSNNLKQIGLALYTYHDVHGCFPPPFITDASGKPTHSWRRLLLDYLESHPPNVVWPIDLAQPWDSPKNLAAAKWMPPCYSCPADPHAAQNGLTNYVMIVGTEAASRPDEHTSRDEMTDGLRTTIIVAEIADSDILWTEPRDLRFDDLSFQINDKTKPSISSHHPHGAMVLLADGSTMFLDNMTSPEELKAMLTRAAKD